MPGRWIGKTVLLFTAVVALIAQVAESAERHVSAVMGEVRQGGSYELPGSSTLWELLQRADGLTSRATGEVRIIRNGRVAIQTHVSTGLRTPILHGDVVVLPARQNRIGADATSVEVCLQNVDTYPIVLRLRPQHADLAMLIKLLKQPADVINRSRVVGGMTKTGKITDGTVLVFDPRTIDRTHLPALPKPILLEPKGRTIQTTSLNQAKSGPVLQRIEQPAKSGNETTPTVEPKSRVQLLVEAARIDLEAGRIPQARAKAIEAQRANAQFGVMDDRPDLILAQIDKRAGNPASPDNETSPATRVLTTVPPPKLAQAIPLIDGFPGETTPDAGTVSNSKPAASAVPVAKVPDGSKPAISSGITTELGGNADLIKMAEAEEESPKAESSFDSITFVIGVFAAFGVLCAAGLLWSMGRRAISQNPSAEPKPRTKRQQLEQLLRNELPIVEEAMKLPPDLEFFGVPNDGKSLRLDAAPHIAAPSRPHFADRVTTGRDQVVQTDRVTPEPEFGGPTERSKPSGPTLRSDRPESAPPQPNRVANPSILDRVLSQVHREEIR